MILKKLVIHEIGPFSPQATIDFDEQVTIFTGPNDTGKSTVLEMIDIIFNSRELEERFVNLDRIFTANSPWTHDSAIRCTATFVMTKYSSLWSSLGPIPAGAQLEVDFALPPHSGNPRMVIRTMGIGDSRTHFNQGTISRFPTLLRLPNEDEIRPVFSVDSLNSTEAQLLQLVFGANFEAKLSSVSESGFRTLLRRGIARLNEQLGKMQGQTGNFELILDRVDKNPFSFTVSLRDVHGGDTPPYLRGSGVRKLVSVLIFLLATDYQSNPVCVLLDEPENSLHADMQHFLRSVLENLAKHENLQVIYATHSPAMINPFKIEGIRLFERKNLDGRAVSVVQNRPFDKNFVRIRSSLGMSPADSLLYAPVTIIVEGITEVIGIPYILLRLHEKKVRGFEHVLEILALCHFLDGEGDSFAYMCRLAKSQGCKPIIFLDGDKIQRVKQQRIEEEHRDVPIILLPEGHEFEDLVPKERYFEALAEVSNQDTKFSAFEQWNTVSSLPARVVFTKRVDRWLQDTFDGISLDKPRTMKRALEIVDLNKVNLEPLRNLVSAISSHLMS